MSLVDRMRAELESWHGMVSVENASIRLDVPEAELLQAVADNPEFALRTTARGATYIVEAE